MKRAVILSIYAVLILILTGAGYFIAKDNKIEYALSGTLLGLIISLVLWVVWGSKNVTY